MKQGFQLRNTVKLTRIVFTIAHLADYRFAVHPFVVFLLQYQLIILRLNLCVYMNLFNHLAYDNLIFQLQVLCLLLLHRQQILLTFDLMYLHSAGYLVFHLSGFRLLLRLHFLNQHRCCFRNSHQNFFFLCLVFLRMFFMIFIQFLEGLLFLMNLKYFFSILFPLTPLPPSIQN